MSATITRAQAEELRSLGFTISAIRGGGSRYRVPRYREVQWDYYSSHPDWAISGGLAIGCKSYSVTATYEEIRKDLLWQPYEELPSPAQWWRDGYRAWRPDCITPSCTLSAGMFEERTVYAHTGWRNIDGANYFLHAGGALGANGHRTDIDVDLPEQLAQFELIEPEDDDALKRAVRESLLLELAPMRVMAPLLGGVYRAPLVGSDITVALYGQTGRGKTELAAIVQRYFGVGMDARRLPLAWESTANTLEMVLSAAKDVMVTIDEYVPGDSQAARTALQAKAERIIRAQGNATGRGRMRADTTLRRVRPPRGQLLSTGEEVPTGQSLRARMMIVELRKGDVDWSRMSRVQGLAAEGAYATAMGGFVKWLAARLDEACEQFQAKRLAIRQEVQAEHKRTADVVAQLGAAWEIYIVFARAIGAIDEATGDGLWQRVWTGLIEVSAEQSDLQEAAEPTARFRDLILAALGTGKPTSCRPIPTAGRTIGLGVGDGSASVSIPGRSAASPSGG